MAKKRPKHGRTVPVDEDRLLATMNHRGLSVEQLAGLADVSVGTVNNLLAGKHCYQMSQEPYHQIYSLSKPFFKLNIYSSFVRAFFNNHVSEGPLAK